MKNNRLTRRGFLRAVGKTSSAVAGFLAAQHLPGTALAAGEKASRVYTAHHPNMVNGNSPNNVQYEWVKAGVDACVKAMTGKDDLGAAWESVFPGIDATRKIAIKINCINDIVHPQFATVKAVVEGMKRMLGGKYPAANISLFDNNLYRSRKVEAALGQASLDSLGIVYSEDSYRSGQTVQVGGTALFLSKFWAEADYGVSLGKMSPHKFFAGGVSGIIKNMMGAVSTSDSTYQAKTLSPGFHDGAPYTAFRDLFANYAKEHLHLYILDMLFATSEQNTSGWSKVVRRIAMGRDPCALEAFNVDQINKLGMATLIPVTKAVPEALAQAGIGTTQYEVVQIPVEVTSPSTDPQGPGSDPAHPSDPATNPAAQPGASGALAATANPASGVAPLTVAFAATRRDAAGQTGTHTWSFGDGESSAEPSPAHTYTVPGSYLVEVRVSDEKGAVLIDNVSVRVFDPADPSPQEETLQGGCASHPAQTPPSNLTLGLLLTLLLFGRRAAPGTKSDP